jgi:hypothetical protein
MEICPVVTEDEIEIGTKQIFIIDKIWTNIPRGA